MQTKEELNNYKKCELSDDELANVVGGCGGSGPVATQGDWYLCEGEYYNYCGTKRCNFDDSAKACGNCTRFTPNSTGDWNGPGTCSGH